MSLPQPLPGAPLDTRDATVTVPAGATVTVSGEVTMPVLPAGPVTLHSGAALAVPAGAEITVLGPAGGSLPQETLTLLDANQIVVCAGRTLHIDKDPVIVSRDLADVGGSKPAHDYRIPANTAITVPGGASISFPGRARLGLPASSRVSTPLDHGQEDLPKNEDFAIPHSSQVVAARMLSLLVASCLTMLGIGAELGILAQLVLRLSTADQAEQIGCLVMAVAAGWVVVAYGLATTRALADNTPGSVLTAAGGTSFTL